MSPRTPSPPTIREFVNVELCQLLRRNFFFLEGWGLLGVGGFKFCFVFVWILVLSLVRGGGRPGGQVVVVRVGM